MDPLEQLTSIRDGLSLITDRTCWDAYDLAQEVIAFINGSDYTIFG